jgi:threonine aldolase
MKIIDLRSDTVTRPTAAMRAAMAAAEVGDDVYGEDPTVNRLEALGADLTGKDAALFVPTGTMANLLAIMAQCGRGDEYICGQEAHCFRFEGGGAAVLGSVQPQPLDFEPDGSIDLAKAAAVVKPDDPHCARTRLLCLENTQAGKVLPLSYLEEAGAFCRERGLFSHLDGARVVNAAVKLGVPLATVTRHVDTVSVCLSKGLGAPAGTLLCGSGSVVAIARRWRKVLGGGMRQSGVLAAAGIVALTGHMARLADDHAHAELLAGRLVEIDELAVDLSAVQSNMVFIWLERQRTELLTAYLKERGILIAGRERLRLVTHLDVSEADIRRVVAEVKRYFRQGH